MASVAQLTVAPKAATVAEGVVAVGGAVPALVVSRTVGRRLGWAFFTAGLTGQIKVTALVADAATSCKGSLADGVGKEGRTLIISGAIDSGAGSVQ